MHKIDISQIKGLPEEERVKLHELITTFDNHSAKNGIKNRYYEGKIPLSEVNLGIALPDGLMKLEIGCAWGGKAVDVLAGRSMFDGFVGINGNVVEAIDRIAAENHLVGSYKKACKDELKFGCVFATLSEGEGRKAKIRFHSPQTAAAKWDGEKNRIAYGFAIIDTAPDNDHDWTPTLLNYYTDEAIWVIEKTDRGWEAEQHLHKMGRPLMEALIWNADSNKPFGKSRIKDDIRRLIQGYVRTVANASIGLEFATSPQKYLLGVTDEQFEAVVNDKFRQYVGSLLAATNNPETGEKPSFGQLMQGTITPHVDMLRILSTQFAAATGLSVTDTGVINDANPTSSDAILAQSQTLIQTAKELNEGNAEALKNIILMALAIENNISFTDLTDEQKAIVAHFKNPAMPSVAVTADAAVKIASVREGFAETDVFLEMLGFDKADIRRIKSQEGRSRGMSLVAEIEG